MYKLKYNEDLSELSRRSNEDKLIPVIIQDYKTNRVLMMAYMNDSAFDRTIKTKKTHFYSRSRKKLWMKGEKSGNFQIVKEIYLDCDNDTLLIKVKQIGNASCHTGYDTCFYRKFTLPLRDRKINRDKLRITGKKIFDPAKVYV